MLLLLKLRSTLCYCVIVVANVVEVLARVDVVVEVHACSPRPPSLAPGCLASAQEGNTRAQSLS